MKKMMKSNRKVNKTQTNWNKAGIGVKGLPLLAAGLLLTVTISGFSSVYSRAGEAYAATTANEKKAMSLIDIEDTQPEEYAESSYVGYGEIVTSDGKTVYSPLISSQGKAYTNLIGAIGLDSNRYVASNYRDSLFSTYNWFTGLKDSAPDPLMLTIDSSLQENLTDYLESKGVDGSVICTDLHTGEIRCMVSTPAAENLTDYEREGGLMNTNLYVTVPGSTMKIVTCLLLEMEGIDIESLTFTCSGEFQLPDGNTVTCEKAHGESISITDAIGDSCNCFFAQAIGQMDWNQVHADFERLGFAVNTPEEVECMIGNLVYRCSEAVISGHDDFNSTFGLIGQGETLVSPLQMTYLTALIATGGDAVPPYLVYGENGMENISLTEEEKALFVKVKDIWEQAYDRYYRVHGIYPEELRAAKTGTAQIGGQCMKKLLMGYSDSYVFYIVINNYIDAEGVKLGTQPVDIAGYLMDELKN